MCKHYIITGAAGSGKTTRAIELGSRYATTTIVRNVEEVGRQIGYLRGDIEEKMAPYFSLYEQLIKDQYGKSVKYLVEQGKIKFTPVTFLRGNTLDGAIILDEAQNLTYKELFTVLTRVGRYGSLIVVGDAAQCDLRQGPHEYERFCDILLECNDVEHIHLTENFRSPLLDEFMYHEEYLR